MEVIASPSRRSGADLTMQLQRLLPLLLISILWQARCQDDDDEEVDFEELEESDVGNERDVDMDLPTAQATHPLFQDCLSHAEAVETEHGLYDDSKGGAEARKKQAAALLEKTKGLVKKESPNFEEQFVQKLQDIHEKGGGFGAPDACDFLLQHFEL